MRIWNWVKEIVGSVGFLMTLADIGGLLGIVLIPFSVTSSSTLRALLYLPGSVGAVLGYFMTASFWRTEKKEVRRKQAKIFLASFIMCLFALAIVLTLLSVDAAKYWPWAEQIREFLVVWLKLTYCLIAILAGAVGYFLISAITISSPKLGKK